MLIFFFNLVFNTHKEWQITRIVIGKYIIELLLQGRIKTINVQKDLFVQMYQHRPITKNNSLDLAFFFFFFLCIGIKSQKPDHATYRSKMK